MCADTLQPGDRVIDLLSIARKAGLLSGTLTGAVITWIVTAEPVRTVLLGLAGAIVGAALGGLSGHIRYVKDGRRHVVKLGPSALRALVAAGLSTSVPVAIVVWLGCLTVLGGPAPSLETGAMCLASGVAMGLLIARLASRV